MFGNRDSSAASAGSKTSYCRLGVLGYRLSTRSCCCNNLVATQTFCFVRLPRNGRRCDSSCVYFHRRSLFSMPRPFVVTAVQSDFSAAPFGPRFTIRSAAKNSCGNHFASVLDSSTLDCSTALQLVVLWQFKTSFTSIENHHLRALPLRAELKLQGKGATAHSTGGEFCAVAH